MYGARGGLHSTIVMPQAAPTITRNETALAGGRLFLINGLISDAGRVVAAGIAEQFGWRLPDVILYPTGGGVGLIGIYEGLRELQSLGWIQGPFAVQASGCAPIVRAWQQRASESPPWEDGSTRAFGINVPKALGDFLVLVVAPLPSRITILCKRWPR